MKFEVTVYKNNPEEWMNRQETVIVEASSKEDAINKANTQLNSQGIIHGRIIDVREIKNGHP